MLTSLKPGLSSELCWRRLACLSWKLRGSARTRAKPRSSHGALKQVSPANTDACWEGTRVRKSAWCLNTAVMPWLAGPLASLSAVLLDVRRGSFDPDADRSGRRGEFGAICDRFGLEAPVAEQGEEEEEPKEDEPKQEDPEEEQ